MSRVMILFLLVITPAGCSIGFTRTSAYDPYEGELTATVVHVDGDLLLFEDGRRLLVESWPNGRQSWPLPYEVLVRDDGDTLTVARKSEAMYCGVPYYKDVVIPLFRRELPSYHLIPVATGRYAR